MQYNNKISLSSPQQNYFLASLFFILLLSLSSTSFSQQNSFVYMKDGKFMLDSNEYFPLAVSYSVNIVKDINNDFYISPTREYCKWGNCGKQNSGFYCGTNVSEWKSKIRKHVDKIAEMGFNSIRLVGLTIKQNPEKTGSNSLSSNKYLEQIDPDNLICFKKHKGYKINRKTFDKHVDLVEAFVKIVKEHNEDFPNEQVKVMITTGNGGLQNFSWLYTRYLTVLGDRFKNDPTVFAYELNFEPYYLGNPHFEIDKKYERAENFAQWYYALKAISPSQLITFGALLQDVFNWDAQSFPVDFINLHQYPILKNNYNSEEFERYKCILKWFSEAYDVPWIIGETGIGGNDAANRQNSSIPTEEQQKEFAYSSLTYSKWYGASGYMWWQYKEVPWAKITDPKARSNYLGIVRMKEENEPHKEAAEVFIDFDPLSDCTTCFDPSPEIYYNPNGHEFLNITGRITTPQGEPIKNAYITYKSKKEGYYTFSDENGMYKMYTLKDDYIYSLKATFPGMTITRIGEWDGPKLGPELNLQIDFLDKDRLPYQE